MDQDCRLKEVLFNVVGITFTIFVEQSYEPVITEVDLKCSYFIEIPVNEWIILACLSIDILTLLLVEYQ